MKFRELKKGQLFKFKDSSGLIAGGPWVKKSARQYYLGNILNMVYQVGSPDVEVVKAKRFEGKEG